MYQLLSWDLTTESCNSFFKWLALFILTMYPHHMGRTWEHHTQRSHQDVLVQTNHPSLSSIILSYWQDISCETLTCSWYVLPADLLLWLQGLSEIIGNNARLLQRFATTVKMWVFEENINGNKLTDIINTEHENIKYLPGYKLPENVVSDGSITVLIFVFYPLQSFEIV